MKKWYIIFLIYHLNIKISFFWYIIFWYIIFDILISKYQKISFFYCNSNRENDISKNDIFWYFPISKNDIKKWYIKIKWYQKISFFDIYHFFDIIFEKWYQKISKNIIFDILIFDIWYRKYQHNDINII